MGDEAGRPTPGTQRRLAIAIVSSVILTVVGRFAVFLLGGWLATPFVLGLVAVVIILTVTEARARQIPATDLLKETVKRMGRRS